MDMESFLFAILLIAALVGTFIHVWCCMLPFGRLLSPRRRRNGALEQRMDGSVSSRAEAMNRRHRNARVNKYGELE
jgi:hypothetical protein